MKEQDRYELLTPQFKTVECGNCWEQTKEYIELTRHIYSNRIHTTVPFKVCFDCIPDVIQYRCYCRNVSDMTGELPGVEEARKIRYLTN